MEIRIRELRNKRGLSQQQLAKKINISSQNISRYERKERLPDIDTTCISALIFSIILSCVLIIFQPTKVKNKFISLRREREI